MRSENKKQKNEQIERQYSDVSEWALKQKFIGTYYGDDPYFVAVDLPLQHEEISDLNRLRKMAKAIGQMNQIAEKDMIKCSHCGWVHFLSDDEEAKVNCFFCSCRVAYMRPAGPEDCPIGCTLAPISRVAYEGSRR